MRHGSLFSGIGGFDLAAEWMGWENVFQCEIDGFCQKVLEKNFPNVKRYGDIKEFDGTKYSGQVDIISGGFPCQPFSNAGQRKGDEDARYLWNEMLRAIGQVKPAYVVAENVTGLLTIKRGLLFEQVCIDLESEGYEVQTFVIPAAGKGADHKRDRVWIVSQSKSCTLIHENKDERQNTQAIQEYGFNGNRKSEPSLRGGIDGIPYWVDRIKSLGNAIVPQIAFEIFKAIQLTQKNYENS